MGKTASTDRKYRNIAEDFACDSASDASTGASKNRKYSKSGIFMQMNNLLQGCTG